MRTSRSPASKSAPAPPSAPAPSLPIIDDPASDVAAAGSGLSQAMAPALPPAGDDEGDDGGQEQAEAVAAAYGAAPRQWKDIPLAPFAISREADWRQHRSALRSPPLEDLIQDPQSMLPDALRVLWFLAHDPQEWLSTPSMQMAGEGTPDARWIRRTAFDMAMDVERKVRAWADLHVDNAEHSLAVRFFYEVFNSAQTTRTTVVPDKHHDPKRAKK